VITTIFPLKDVTEKIGGEEVNVSNLLPSGSSPHTFEPKPEQVKELKNAQLCIRIGLSADFWLDKIILSGGNNNLKILTASEYVSLLKEEKKYHPDEQKSRNGINPHIWLDPVRMIKICKQIANALIEIKPSEKEYFNKNLIDYIDNLKQLDKEIKETVTGFESNKFVAMHSAWIYFAERYGLIQAAVISPSPGKEPTPKYISELIETLKRIKAKAVFAEYRLNPKLAQTIAEETKTRVLLLDPLGDKYSGDRNTYIKMMKYNLKIMEEGLN